MYFFLVIVAAEVLLFLLFRVLDRCFLMPLLKKSGSHSDKNVAVASVRWPIETLKGILERLTVTYGLIQGVPQILIFFGALKVATRLALSADEHAKPGWRQRENAFNSYFIVGNLSSILAALFYLSLYRYFFN